MAPPNTRPGLRERVAMRKRGLDPDRPSGLTPRQRQMKLIGLVLQIVSVFVLLGYIVYYTQGERVVLQVELLVFVSGIFVFGRVLTFLGGNKTFRL
ncbi:MAG: hypothetical protein AAF607_08260 [Pseudomonadota bacterium]